MLTLSSTPEYYSQLESSGYMGHLFSQLLNFTGKIHPFLASAKLAQPIIDTPRQRAKPSKITRSPNPINKPTSQ
jgi:hypothetical protein